MIWLLMGCASAPPVDPTWGQWIWTDADVAVFEATRRDVPDLVPTVWIATIHAGGRTELGHSPRGLPNPAVLVRIDADWRWDADATAILDDKLSRLWAMTADAGVTPRELEIDYDCPVSKLPVYATALGALHQRRPWITSLASHVAEPAYGDLFRGVAAGHIVQVFDTGDDPGTADHLRAHLDRAAMPFRLGLGAFEREDRGVIVTHHRAWFAAGAPIRHSPWYRGSWVFPAGRSWTALREER